MLNPNLISGYSICKPELCCTRNTKKLDVVQKLKTHTLDRHTQKSALYTGFELSKVAPH
jgi:hypothetical protein